MQDPYHIWQGGYYDLQNMTYYIVPDGTALTNNAYTMATYYWEVAAGSPVNFTYSSYNPKVRCHGYPNYQDPNFTGTTWFSPPTGQVVAAWTWINSYTLGGYVYEKRLGTAGHELGHALTLAHRFGTIMTDDDWWRWDAFHIYAPTSDDIYELNERYYP